MHLMIMGRLSMLPVSKSVRINNRNRLVQSTVQHVARDESIFVVFCQMETLLKLFFILELSVTVTLQLRKFPQDSVPT